MSQVDFQRNNNEMNAKWVWIVMNIAVIRVVQVQNVIDNPSLSLLRFEIRRLCHLLNSS